MILRSGRYGCPSFFLRSETWSNWSSVVRPRYSFTVRHCDCPVSFHISTPKVKETPKLLRSLCSQMQSLQPTPGTNHGSQTVYIPSQLLSSSPVFVRVDAKRPPLQPRYNGPYAVLDRREKTFKIQMHSRQPWISVDRLKPAFILNDNPPTTPTQPAKWFNQQPHKPSLGGSNVATVVPQHCSPDVVAAS